MDKERNKEGNKEGNEEISNLKLNDLTFKFNKKWLKKS